MTATIIPAEAGTIAKCDGGTELVIAWAISYDATIEDYRVIPLGVFGEVLDVIGYKINGRYVIAV